MILMLHREVIIHIPISVSINDILRCNFVSYDVMEAVDFQIYFMTLSSYIKTQCEYLIINH